MKDIAKETFPVPSGSRILDTYGNVIKGNMNDDIVRIEFITKFNFRDGFLETELPAFGMITIPPNIKHQIHMLYLSDSKLYRKEYTISSRRILFLCE